MATFPLNICLKPGYRVYNVGVMDYCRPLALWVLFLRYAQKYLLHKKLFFGIRAHAWLRYYKIRQTLSPDPYYINPIIKPDHFIEYENMHK